MTNRVGDACGPDINDLELCISLFEASSLEAKTLRGKDSLENGKILRVNLLGYR